MFASIEEVMERFAAQQYICNRAIATVVYLAAQMRKPILIEGPAGVGKTELAKVVALATGQPQDWRYTQRHQHTRRSRGAHW